MDSTLNTEKVNIAASFDTQFDLSCCKAFVDAVDAQVAVFRDAYAVNLEQQERLTMMTYMLDELSAKLTCVSEKIDRARLKGVTA